MIFVHFCIRCKLGISFHTSECGVPFPAAFVEETNLLSGTDGNLALRLFVDGWTDWLLGFLVCSFDLHVYFCTSVRLQRLLVACGIS